MEFSITGLSHPLPPYLPKIMENFENTNYFMASKSGLVLK